MAGSGGEDLAVVVEGVVKIYESRGERIVALREVSLSVARGEVLAIMGPSGSGKTTLLNIIAGIDRPNAGRVIVDGFEVSSAGGEELRRFRLERVGYVFQQHNLIPTLTALENILLPMALAGKASRLRGQELLRRVGLEGKERRYPEELSGGEQQRLAVAVALANDPPIIVADEPTGELDIATGERIVRILLEEAHSRGKTVVLTTHDPRVARMADRVAVIEDGRLRGVYSPSRIAGATGFGEVEAERAVEAVMRRILDDAERRLKEAEDRFRRGEVGIDVLVETYTRVKALREAVREELSRLGITG
ncbi:conserved hypothetical protein [Aeropyrum pernix]|uniref:ABC transporter domain-containing protein n=1 Tax=Aeropyrum pernix TaxID=56636 RepID=A0A401HBM8_AERPX|nr:ABC transporter ATP-binding protein [Aeropyrum pernix]GBF09833.1 conserved hypothetical protein [Aeropyrum pernix]